MKAIRCELPFCVVVLFLIFEPQDLFAICAYLNVNVTSTSNPHVNIANPIKINKLMTVYLKSIMSRYFGLSKWCVDSVFASQLQDLI